MSTIKVLIADDHAVVREGTRQILEQQPDMSIVAEAVVRALKAGWVSLDDDS